MVPIQLLTNHNHRRSRSVEWSLSIYERASHLKFTNDLCFQVPLLKFQSEEMTIWSQLEHCNIVKLYGVLRWGQKIYFLEECIDGKLIRIVGYGYCNLFARKFEHTGKGREYYPKYWKSEGILPQYWKN